MARKKKPKSEPMSDEAYEAMMAEVKRPKSNEEKRFIKLGWELLEAKYRYYKLDAPLLEDYAYDRLEREYDDLSKKLGLEPTAANMVGFDINRPSASLVADRVDGQNSSKNPDEALSS